MDSRIESDNVKQIIRICCPLPVLYDGCECCRITSLSFARAGRRGAARVPAFPADAAVREFPVSSGSRQGADSGRFRPAIDHARR